MFAQQQPEQTVPVRTVAIAVVALAVLAGGIVMLARRPATPANAAYAAHIRISDLKISEADSHEGFSKLIYIEGHVTNSGAANVTGVGVRVSFPSDSGPAQVEIVPMNVITMRQPYIDTRPVSAAAPLAAGASADFRLIFDDIKDTWNQQMPALQVVSVAAK